MRKFTEEQIRNLEEQTKQILDSMAEDESARDIMAKLYVNNLDEKTMEQGYAMADKMIETIKDFDSRYSEALEDADKYLAKFAETVEKEKSVKERCDYWLRFAATITAAVKVMETEKADAKQILSEIEVIEIPEEEATEEKANELRNTALEVLKNSGIMFVGLEQVKKDLEETNTADEAAEIIIEMGNRENDSRAIMSMLAYTQVKTGEYDNIPVDMNATQITTAVCVGVEEVRIADKVSVGKLLVDIAAALLSVLGIVAITLLAIDTAVFGVAVITEIFPFLLALPLVIMFGIGIANLLGKGYDLWIKESKIIVRGVAKAVKSVVSGLVAICNYVVKSVIPGIINICKKAWNKLFGKKEKTTADTTAVTEENEENEEVILVDDDKVLA